MGKQKSRPHTNPPTSGFRNTALAEKLQQVATQLPRVAPGPGDTPGAKPVATPPTPALPDLTRTARVLLRRDRKGRGGKTVTLIAGLELPEADLQVVLQELQRTLGCGGALEAGRLVLAGDQGERLRTWLLAHGVKQVVGP